MNLTHSELDLDLNGVHMPCTVTEIEAAFSGLLREVRAAVPHIRPDERDALRKIMAHAGEQPTVSDIFPDFERDSDAHTTLRKLRTAQFIRPAGRDSWGHHAQIEVKPFAKIAWDRLGEATLFGDEPAPESEQEPDSDIDLALPGADAEERENEVPAKWNEDDVLDYLNDDTPS